MLFETQNSTIAAIVSKCVQELFDDSNLTGRMFNEWNCVQQRTRTRD